MSWETVTLPRRGLGIRSAKGRNLALLGKFAWRAASNDRSWTRVMRRNYEELVFRQRANQNTLNRAAMELGGHVCSIGSRWVSGMAEA